MFRFFFIIIFLLFNSSAFAQNFRITNKAQHPYRHQPTDLNTTNTASNGQCLTFDSGTNQFTWAACGTGGGGGSDSTLSGWTDAGTRVQLVTSTDNVTIGSTNNGGKLFIDGDTDEVQAQVQGNATQTSDILVVEQSDGTDIFTGAVGGVKVTGDQQVTGRLYANNLSGTNTGDQDLSVYTLVDGTRAFTGTISGVTPTTSSHLATKDYVDNAVVSINTNFYLLDSASGISDYKDTTLTIPSSALANDPHTVTSNGQYLRGWISPTGATPTTLVAGIYDLYIEAKVDATAGTKRSNLYWELVEYKADTTEVIIGTSESSDELTTTASDYNIHYTLPADYTVTAGSRIVGKIRSSLSGAGANPVVTLYYLGSVNSHWSVPTNTEVLNDSYIRRDGTNQLTGNWGAGSYNITSNGTISALNLSSTTKTGTGVLVYNNAPTMTSVVVGTKLTANNSSGGEVWTAQVGGVKTTGDQEITGSLKLSGYNCTTKTSGGTLTTNSAGFVQCQDDDTGGGVVSLTDLSDVGTATITAGRILVADGTVFQSVAMGGDATLASDGSLSLSANSVSSNELSSTGVSSNTYLAANLTVDADGRLTNAARGSLTSLSDVGTATITAGRLLVANGTVFQSVALGGDATLASDGSLSLATNSVAANELSSTGVSSNTYLAANITVDSDGRLTNAARGSLTSLSDVGSATITAGRLLIANGTNFQSVAMSGDITITSAGVTDIGANKVVAADLASAVVDNSMCNGRLTLTSATAVTVSDVTAAGTIYFTPYKGNRVALYDGTNWAMYNFTERSLALTLTSGKNYDVFLYDNAGTLTLELSSAWTNDTTRADALALQDGVLVKSGATTRRYLGTIRASAANQTEDSLAKRFVWNMYNRVKRNMKVVDTTDSWTYTTATWRAANNSTANRLQYVVGQNEDLVTATVRVLGNNSSAASYAVGVGVDVTNANSAWIYGSADAQNSVNVAFYTGFPGIGFHFLQWVEESTAVGTTTFFGDAGLGDIQSGIIGDLFN